jgi:hypothetical protein
MQTGDDPDDGTTTTPDGIPTQRLHRLTDAEAAQAQHDLPFAYPNGAQREGPSFMPGRFLRVLGGFNPLPEPSRLFEEKTSLR